MGHSESNIPDEIVVQCHASTPRQNQLVRNRFQRVYGAQRYIILHDIVNVVRYFFRETEKLIKRFFILHKNIQNTQILDGSLSEGTRGFL